MEGRLLRSGDVAGAMEAGIAYVSEDRKRAGLVPSATVGENLSLAVLRRLQKWGFIQARRERAAIGWAMETLRIDPPDPGQLVGRLSGGNQQKVVLGRCLLTEPKVLLLDEPTRGVDVGAKREIYSLISNFTKSNGGVVMVSSEIEEMMEVCDRILILRRGRLVEALSGAALTANRLMMVAG
jgi:putative xylitol transport system ATP-binding protein